MDDDRPGLVLVDDHAAVVQSLAAGLQSALEVRVTAIGPEALTSASIRARTSPALAPRVALMDLHLGSLGSALPLFPAVAAMGTRVVVLTASDDPVTLARAVEAGATGLLRKATGFDELVEQVRDALAGRPLIGDAEREALAATVRRHRRTEDERLAPFAALTRRERVVLRGLVDGLTPDQIAERDLVSIHTVRTQVKAVLRKLGVSSQVGAVTLAHRTGWHRPAG